MADRSAVAQWVVECLTRDQGATGSSLTGDAALCPRASHINPSLVLVQPRKTLLMRHKNEIKQNKIGLTVKMKGQIKCSKRESMCSKYWLTASSSLPWEKSVVM